MQCHASVKVQNPPTESCHPILSPFDQMSRSLARQAYLLGYVQEEEPKREGSMVRQSSAKYILSYLHGHLSLSFSN